MYVKFLLGISACAAVAAASSAARSETAFNTLMSTVNVNGSLTCGDIEIGLNRPVTFKGDFPSGSGTDLDIRVEPLATTTAGETSKALKEAGSLAPGNTANLSAVVFDPTDVGGPVFHLTFSIPMAFRVKLDDDNRHLRIAVSPVQNMESCIGKAATVAAAAPSLKLETAKTDLPAASPLKLEAAKGDLPTAVEVNKTEATAIPDPTLPEAPTADQGSKTDVSAKPDAPAPIEDGASALREGKKALLAGDFARATAYFTKGVTIGNGAEKQETQELLGLSRERAGQLAFARAEYETYLKLYPNGAGAKRVKDRLNSVTASMEDKANQEFALRQEKRLAEMPKTLPVAKGNTAVLSSPGIAGNSAGLVVTRQGVKMNVQETPVDPQAWTWDKHGSFAQYYYRDDSLTQSTPGAGPLDAHTTPNNMFLSNAFYYIRGENQDYAIEANIAGDNQKGIGDQSDLATTSLGTVYLEGVLKGPKIGARVGRQSRSTGGVFGRFDGGNFSWEPMQGLKTQTVVGSPVYGSKSQPFADGRYFYGASIDYTLPSKEWAGGIYAVEQDINGVVDRRAIGAELRYQGKNLYAYSAADYDVFYGELNNAYVSGTWNPREGTSIYATADYRKSPFLLTSNALSGENFGQLSTLIDAVGQDTAYQWASLRTASSETFSIGASQEILKDWQLTLDATIANYSGTPPSGSQTGFAAPGIEYYLSSQITGMSVFRENDSLSAGLRFSTSDTNNLYMFDTAYRFAVNDKWRLSPRIRLSLGKSHASKSETTTYTVIPSLKSTYRIDKKWSFEAEVSANWKEMVTATMTSQSVDILASAGYRFEF
jgi:hypothetical protein